MAQSLTPTRLIPWSSRIQYRSLLSLCTRERMKLRLSQPIAREGRIAKWKSPQWSALTPSSYGRLSRAATRRLLIPSPTARNAPSALQWMASSGRWLLEARLALTLLTTRWSGTSTHRIPSLINGLLEISTRSWSSSLSLMIRARISGQVLTFNSC